MNFFALYFFLIEDSGKDGTLREETFAEEIFAISRIFGQNAKVYSREKTPCFTLVIFLKSKLFGESETENISYPNFFPFYFDIKVCNLTVYFGIQKFFLRYFHQF